jgi:hypothetical protein
MLTDLNKALGLSGFPVVEYDGWKTRGHGQMAGVRGVLCHHTAGPAKGNTPSLSVVVNGRTGLPGPLCNLYLARDGTWYTIAAGLGYHAGSGSVPGVPTDMGNNYLIGIEAESTGYGDWTDAQLVSYPMGVSSLNTHYGLVTNQVWGHLEYTTRKIDPALWPGGMNGFRQQVQSGPQRVIPKAANEELTEMIVGQDQSDGKLYLISGNCKLEFPSGGGDPSGIGHGNIYADELLSMLNKAYPDGGKPALVPLNHDIVMRIPDAWTFIDGSAVPVKPPPAQYSALEEGIQP